MIQEQNGKPKQRSACDLKHRISTDETGNGPSGYYCCDSRQCLFKVEMNGRNFCLLEKPDGDGA